MKATLKFTIVLLIVSIISCKKEGAGITSVSQSNSSDGTAAFQIGQNYHGGIIFYIDNTGQHGLIVSKEDLSTQIAWNNGNNIITNATDVTVGSGNANTKKIVNAQGTSGSYAALLCYNYSISGYKNWYLPSKKELALLYAQKAVAGISSGDYWSSSEVSRGKAWEQEFGGGYQFKYNKSFTLHVRAVSSF